MQIKPTMNRIIALRSVLLGWLCIGVYSIGMNTLHKNEPTRVKTWALGIAATAKKRENVLGSFIRIAVA